MIAFSVPGLPATQGSKRYIGNGRFIDSCKRLPAWRSLVAHMASQVNDSALIDGAISLSIKFVLPRPKGHYGKKGLRPAAPKYPTGKPDLCKMVRAVEDALKGVVWTDDSRVVVYDRVIKVYADNQGEFIGAHVQIMEVEKLEQPNTALETGAVERAGECH
jgi:crossover junction endodeoxyribonuclease RusA